MHEFTLWIDGFYPGETDPAVVGRTANPEGDPLEQPARVRFRNRSEPAGRRSAELGRARRWFAVHRCSDDAFPGAGVDFKGRYMRRIDGSAGYTLEFSSDLNDWEVMAPAESVLTTDGDYQLVEFSYPLFLSNARKARFFRVTVSQL